MAKVWKRKDRNVWVADYRDSRGHRIRLTAGTREEAENLLAEKIRLSRQAAPAVENPDVRLSDYGAKWLDAVEPDIESKTFRSYKQLLTQHIFPKLGHLRVRDIHRGHLKALLSEKRRKGYAKNSVRLIRAAISSLLTDAVDEGIIQTNPALGLANRKKRRGDRITQTERQQNIRPMNPLQLQMFFEKAASDRRYFTFFLLLARTGLRPGEARALYPEDVDLQAQQLRVERALSGMRLKGTKTGETRTVDLSPGLIVQLQDHLRWIKEEALRLGQGQPHWLFSNREGKPLEERKIGRAFHRALKQAKIPMFRVYDLRHTYASILLAAGVPLTYVSTQLGHAKPTTTLQHYAKWIPGGERRFVDLLDAKVGTKTWHQTTDQEEGELQVVDFIGGPSRTRTCDPLIMSQLL
jgi:integrase